MAKAGTVSGWKLNRDQRAQLLDRFPPRYAEVVADHVTLRVDSGRLPPTVEARVVGRADDGESLDCLVVALDGITHRPDGSTFHITWSLGPGRKARESNAMLRERGWEQFDAPIAIDLIPARW